MDAKEEIRSRLNIEDVIGEYVRLQRAGKDLKGLSPFTSEKTPSFMVSPDKHVWYDFSSNIGGDVFNFIMKVENLDFRGAMELLAQKAGVDLSLYGSGDRKVAEKKKRLYSLLEFAAKYYQQTLLKNERAIEYVFKTRGLSKEVVQEFRIGFAPDTNSSVVDFLKKRGFTQSDIKDAGMTNRRGGDLFRARIMVPLMDGTGQVIGFTGRLIENDPKAPKYLNTPQTLLYDKSSHVFGLSQSKEAIRGKKHVVMVEGNLDVISSHQADAKQVVAAAGTALTERHLKTVKRFAPEIRLCFDGDRAGIAATERAIKISQTLDIQLKIISLPNDAKDPDELIQSDPELWQQAIGKSMPAIDWVLSEYKERYDIATGEGKKQYSSESLKLIKMISDEVEQDHYVAEVAKVLGSSIEALHRKLSGYEGLSETPLRSSKTSVEKKAELYPHQDALIGLGLLDPKTRALLIGINPQEFIESETQTILKYLQQNQEEVLNDNLPGSLQEVETYVKIALLKADERYGAWSELDRYDETARLIKLMKRKTTQQNKARLIVELRKAEDSSDETSAQKLRTELNKLIKEMK